MKMNRKKEKIVLEIEVKLWKVGRGHSAHRGGAGAMGDRRTKRQRTRSEKNRTAIRESM
jgi:hypothetical protein